MMRVLIFAFLPFAAFAQSRYTVLDTAYTMQDSLFYEVHEVKYSTGEAMLTKTLIGDSTAVFNAYFIRVQDEAGRMSRLAQKVFSFGNDLKSLKKENDVVLSVTGRDALDTITARYAAQFTTDGWKIKDAAAVDVSFSVNANGQLRYQISGQAARNADLYGDALTLNNYLGSGSDLFLFKTESGNYRNRDGTILLRSPGGAQNRGGLPARSFEAETVKLEPVIPEKKPEKKSKKKKKE